jgi:small subunit ribosomal protein S16
MAVRIRLRRMGAKKRPFYRLVVADSHNTRDGRFIETIGEYDPVAKPARIDINLDKARQWINNGALPSETAKRLLKQAGVYDSSIPEKESADQE